MVYWAAFPLTGPADLNERLTHPESKSRRLPTSAHAYGSLAQSYFLTDRFPEAESTLQRASERKLERPINLVMRYNIALLNGDQEQMDRAVGLAKGKQGAEHGMAHAEALALARSGRLQAARRSSSRAVDLALQGAEREAAATYQAARAVWEAVCGNAAEAKRNAMAALALSNGRDVKYMGALALALSGDSSRSQPLADDLEKRFPEDTFAKFTYVPVLRALSALDRRKPTDSVEQLQIALPYELAVNGLNFNHFYLGGLHSAYVRGEAFAGRAPVCGSGRRVSEDPRSSRDRRRGSDWCAGTPAIRSNIRSRGGQGQGKACLRGFSHPLERRRLRHSDSGASEGGVRPAAIAPVSTHPLRLRVPSADAAEREHRAAASARKVQ